MSHALLKTLKPEADQQIFGGFSSTHHANTWSYKGPAPLHPWEWPVTDHTSNIVHEPVSTCARERLILSFYSCLLLKNCKTNAVKSNTEKIIRWQKQFSP